jgi:hypothetical protein
MNYRDWHIPLARDDLTLAEARQSLAQVSAHQDEIPFMVQLVENPKYTLPGVTLFHGAVDLHTHDNIHIILGRGLLAMDEAFVIGFTMGSTNRVSSTEEQLFAFISKNLYPDVYRFSDEDIAVFRNGVRLAFISGCRALDQVDDAPMADWTLAKIRAELGIETDLLHAYYGLEKRRYPESKASQRLV